jgi:hypothetical protein
MVPKIAALKARFISGAIETRFQRLTGRFGFPWGDAQAASQ